MKKLPTFAFHMHPLLISLSLLLATILTARFAFVVQRVHCQVDDQHCSPQTTQVLERQLVGKSLFFSDLPGLSSEATQPESLTLTSLSKALPSTVLVHFTSEPVLYRLQIQDAESSTVGTQGTIKPASNDSNLPRVRVTSTDSQLLEHLSTGGRVPSTMHEPLKAIIGRLQSEKLSADEITWVSDDEIWVQLNSVRFVLDARHPAGSVTAVAQILDTLESSPLPEPVREIDVRFTLPVLRTAQ